MSRPSSTQIGTIAVNHVANALMVSTGGRLSVYSPVADDDGLDLLAYDKISGKAMPIQVKSRTVTLKKRRSQERGNVVHFEIRKATYRSDRYAYAVLVLLSEDALSIERAWLVPMRDMSKYATSRKEKYVFRVSKLQYTTDRCTELQCEDLRELGERVLEELQREPSPANAS